MLNTFFYAARPSVQSLNLVEYLQTIPDMAGMFVLPSGSNLNTPLALKMRCGDLILLFAASRHELEDLITLVDEFDRFHVILILDNSDLIGKEALRLKPRFVFMVDDDSCKLGEVIRNIVKKDRIHEWHDMTMTI